MAAVELVGLGTGPSAPTAGLCILSDGRPTAVVGAGPGALRHVTSLFGAVPVALVLPAAKAYAVSELQGFIEASAAAGQRLAVYAPGDVLDVAMSLIDDDAVPLVRDAVEFLQVEPRVATLLGDGFLVATPVPHAVARYNIALLDAQQRTLVALLDGPCPDPVPPVLSTAACVASRASPSMPDAATMQRSFPAAHFIVHGAAAHAWSPTSLVVSPGDAVAVAPGSGAPPVTRTLGSLHHGPDDAASRPLVASVGETPSRSGFGNSRRATTPRATTPRATTPRPGRTETMGGASQYEPQGSLFGRKPSAPRRLHVFSNEERTAAPVVVMLSELMSLQAFREKLCRQLPGIRPLGGLYTVAGGLVRTVDDLEHGQEVVATKHAGAPFSLSRLPTLMGAKQSL